VSKLTRVPTSGFQRWKNRVDRFGVPCFISSRWLRFDSTYNMLGGEPVVWVDVMTGDPKDELRKLCRVCISLSDLKNVMGRIQAAPERCG
jgi:hypothetical protein